MRKFSVLAWCRDYFGANLILKLKIYYWMQLFTTSESLLPFENGNRA